MLRSIPFLIGFACLGLSACATTGPTARNGYGYAPEATYKTEHTGSWASYHPCHGSGHPDDMCNRQQYWPSGQ